MKSVIMIYPKFAVGEVVILCSKYQPECNGEYTIQRVVHGDRPNIVTNETETGYHYQLEGLVGSEGNVLWLESSLRKKYQPGEMSFDKLMGVLNSPPIKEKK